MHWIFIGIDLYFIFVLTYGKVWLINEDSVYVPNTYIHTYILTYVRMWVPYSNLDYGYFCPTNSSLHIHKYIRTYSRNTCTVIRTYIHTYICTNMLVCCTYSMIWYFARIHMLGSSCWWTAQLVSRCTRMR